MDWIEEKAEQLKTWIRDLTFRKAMLAYIAAAALISVILSAVTMTVCYRFESIIWNKYADMMQHNEVNGVLLWPDWSIAANWNIWAKDFAGFKGHDRQTMLILDIIRVWCPFFYSFSGTVAAVFLFYSS